MHITDSLIVIINMNLDTLTRNDLAIGVYQSSLLLWKKLSKHQNLTNVVKTNAKAKAKAGKKCMAIKCNVKSIFKYV